MKKHASGFTLIELMAFIIVSAILLNVLMFGSNIALRQLPTINNQWRAIQIARGCVENYLQAQRNYQYQSLTCPSTPSTGICPVPSGYSVAMSVTCTTWNGDSTYKTLTVTVSGAASTSLSVLLGAT